MAAACQEAVVAGEGVRLVEVTAREQFPENGIGRDLRESIGTGVVELWRVDWNHGRR